MARAWKEGFGAFGGGLSIMGMLLVAFTFLFLVLPPALSDFLKAPIGIKDTHYSTDWLSEPLFLIGGGLIFGGWIMIWFGRSSES